MLKAILKKQLAELFYPFYRKRNKKGIATGSIVGTVVLYATLFLILGASFFSMSTLLAISLAPEEQWFLFALMGLLSLLLGVFGSVFNSYASLYLAKDNEMLLSMPIPPRMILTARMIGVFLMSMLYSGLIYLPALAAFWIFGHPTFVALITSLLFWIVLGFLTLVLTCGLGFLVAVIASKLKNKSFITVIIVLVFLAFYFVFCFNSGEIFESMFEDLPATVQGLKDAFYPAFFFGSAAVGSLLPFLTVSAGAAVLLGVTVWAMAASFLGLAGKQQQNTRVSEKKAAKDRIEQSSVRKALLKKERKRLFGSSTYMLNGALGTFMMPLAGAALLIFSGNIQEFLFDPEMPIPTAIFAVIPAAITCFLCTMNMITASTISLEGKNLWMLQSLPIRPREIFLAKEKLHLEMTVLPAAFLYVCACVAFRLDLLSAIGGALLVLSFITFLCTFGLTVNLLKPDLSWTNEAIPVKQSFAVFACSFGGMIFSIIMNGAIIALSLLVSPILPETLFILLLAVGTVLFERYLWHEGESRFAKL